jgi:hypothetical protein
MAPKTKAAPNYFAAIGKVLARPGVQKFHKIFIRPHL